jgi:hypothetical protein
MLRKKLRRRLHFCAIFLALPRRRFIRPDIQSSRLEYAQVAA